MFSKDVQLMKMISATLNFHAKLIFLSIHATHVKYTDQIYPKNEPFLNVFVKQLI